MDTPYVFAAIEDYYEYNCQGFVNGEAVQALPEGPAAVYIYVPLVCSHENMIEGAITLEPTCTKDGEKEMKCPCGFIEKVPVKATGHNFGPWRCAQEATTASQGRMHRDCYCGQGEDLPIAKIKSCKLSKTKYTYNGKVIKPSVSVVDDLGNQLLKGTDYDVTYSKGCKAAGKYNAIVMFKGKYSGTKTLSFTIMPKLAKIKKVTEGKKSMKIAMTQKASKLSATGYQIQYKVKGTSKWKTVKTSASYKTIKALKKGKRYQVRVCTYKKIGKTVILGTYTKIKTSKKIK